MPFPRLETYQERKQHDAAGYNTVCPQCGRGFGHAANRNEAKEHSWARYIGEDGRPIDARECGMCLHHTSCGYHLPPREYYKRKRDDEARLRPRRRLDKNETLRYDSDTALCAYDGDSHSDSEKQSNDSSINRFNRHEVPIGQQQSCDSPLGQSDSECHRRHAVPYRYGSDAPTLFLTEGEKAAVYGTLLWPQHVWMATGGKQNLKADLLEPLRGYAIQALPDADALDDWCHAAADLRRQGFDITIPWRWFYLMQSPAHAATNHDLEDVWPELTA